MADSRAILVLGRDRSLHAGHTTIQGGPIDTPTLDAAYRLAVRYEARAVWLLNRPAAAYPGWWRVEAPAVAHLSGPRAPGAPTVARVRPHYKSSPTQAVMVYNVTEDSRWPWYTENDPAAVLGAVQALETALGIPLGYSPAGMALTLMERTNAKHRAWLAYPDLDLPPVISQPAQYVDRIACRDASLTSARRYVHLYDTRGAYLAAAQSVDLGCGPALDHRHTESVWVRGDRPANLPGIYRVREASVGGPVIHQAGWYDLATLRAACDMGQRLVTDEAYTWPEHHTALRAWASLLWRARESTTGYAQQAVKDCYTAGIGRLRMQPAASPSRDDRRPEWHRPLWHAAILAEAARRQWANFARYQRAGAVPILLDTDTIGLLSVDPEARDLTPLNIERAGLGGYRHVCTAPVNDRLREMWGRSSAPLVVRLIRAIAAEGVVPDA